MTRQWRPSRRIWLVGGVGVAGAIATVVILSIALRRELWLDETHSALLANMGWRDLLEFVRGDVHPPVYFLVLKIWVGLVGDSPVGLRSLSLLSHLLGSVAFTAAAWLLLEARIIALFAGLMFLFSPAMVFHASEARMYPLVLAFAAVSFLGLSGAYRGWRRRGLIVVVLAITLAALTHYTALFFAVGFFAGWLVSALKKDGRPALPVALGIASALLAAAWFPVMISQKELKAQQTRVLALATADSATLSYGTTLESTGTSELLVTHALNLASVAGVYPARNRVLLAVLLLPFVVASLATLGPLRRRDRLALLAALSILTVVGGAVFLGVGGRRYVLLAAPGALLWLSRGLDNLASRGRAKLAVATASAMACIALAGTIRLWRTDFVPVWAPVVAAVDSLSGPDELVVFSAAYGQVPFEYFAKRRGLNRHMTGFPRSVHDWWESQAFKGWGGAVVTVEQLTRFVDTLPDHRLWLVDFEAYKRDPHGMLIDRLAGSRTVREVELPQPSAGPPGRLAVRLFEVVPTTSDQPGPASRGESARAGWAR